jgi:hypothetical protein
MTPREWTHIDKSGWGPGAWQDEPDKIQWVDEETGLDCLMVRHDSLGHWCGYVGVAEGHPAFEKDYDDVDVRVHGGLTFAAACQADACHVPEPGRPEKVWWLGFDCAHAFDLSPSFRGRDRIFGDRADYRDRAYVEAEIAALAGQLTAVPA